MSICRICKQSGADGRMLKYSTRHYAHFTCWMDKRGANSFQSLKYWQLGKFPVFEAQKRGLRKHLEDAYHAAAEREGKFSASY